MKGQNNGTKTNANNKLILQSTTLTNTQASFTLKAIHTAALQKRQIPDLV